MPLTPRLLKIEPLWLWLEKPAGLPIFPPHEGEGSSLLTWLLEARPEQAQAFPAGFEGGIAHRLDTWTSGLVLAARSPEALAEAREAFASKELRKQYVFLTDRRVAWTEHHLTVPLAHHERRKDRMVPQRGANTPHRGRWYPADTRLRHLGGGLWEAVIRTGVMHQIRVHAAWAGLPILGDRLYGGAPMPGGEPGFCLHAQHLEGLGEAPECPPPASWALLQPR